MTPRSSVTSGTRRCPADGRLVVLHSLRPPDGTTKYVDHMVGCTAPGVEVRFFSWPAALAGRYDVLHVHWPEQLIRDRRGRWRRLVKRRMLDVLLLRLRVRGIPLVWTAHNISPHEEGTAAELRSLRRFARGVDLVVRLNPASPVSCGAETVTIPHGHYRRPFARYPVHEAEPGRLLYFGIIRRYKGVDALCDAFSELDSPHLRLRVVGHPHPGQAEAILAAFERDPRISGLLRFVDDAVLVEEISRSQLVVLPYRGTMHNSGALLAALSLGRPVLVPESPTNAALAEEVGPGWVIRYSGALTAEVLEKAVAATADARGEPRLDERDWDRVARAHRDAYRRARASKAHR